MKVLIHLLRVFFIIASVVHVVGFFEPVSDESAVSHSVHLISYAGCALLTGRIISTYRLVLLLGLGGYPLGYHLHCFIVQAITGKFSIICLMVVVAVPLAWTLGFRQKTSASAKW